MRGLEGLIERAQQQELSHLEFLDMILADECEKRDTAALRRRVQEACFPYLKRLEDFDCSFNTSLNAKQAAQLGGLKWVEKIFNLILVGPPDVGKTHLAIGLERAAVEKGYAVSFVSMKELVQLLKTAVSLSKQSGLNSRRFVYFLN